MSRQCFKCNKESNECREVFLPLCRKLATGFYYTLLCHDCLSDGFKHDAIRMEGNRFVGVCHDHGD